MTKLVSAAAVKCRWMTFCCWNPRLNTVPKAEAKRASSVMLWPPLAARLPCRHRGRGCCAAPRLRQRLHAGRARALDARSAAGTMGPGCRIRQRSQPTSQRRSDRPHDCGNAAYQPVHEHQATADDACDDDDVDELHGSTCATNSTRRYTLITAVQMATMMALSRRRCSRRERCAAVSSANTMSPAWVGRLRTPRPRSAARTRALRVESPWFMLRPSAIDTSGGAAPFRRPRRIVRRLADARQIGR